MKNIAYFFLLISLIGCSKEKEPSNSMYENNIELENRINNMEQKTDIKPGHTGIVQSVVFSPDGKQIISCSYDDKYIRIWDAATGQQIKTLLHDNIDNNKISFIRLTPDGKYIVSSSYTGTIIWDRNTNNEIISFYGSLSELITAIDITPNGKQIAVLYLDLTSPGRENILRIKLFDATTGKQVYTFLGYIEKITSFAFSPDGSRVITGFYDDGVIKIWDTATEQELKTISEDLSHVDFISFSPDGKYFITRSEVPLKRYITIWDANTGIKIRSISIYLNNNVPIAISPDGSIIATLPYDTCTIQLLDIATGNEIKTISDFSGHKDKIKSLAFSPDGKMIVSGSADKSIILWDVATGEKIRTMGE